MILIYVRLINEFLLDVSLWVSTAEKQIKELILNEAKIFCIT